MSYDYRKEMKEDIKDYILENGIDVMNDEQSLEELYDDLWIKDSVTGNASGSYTFNTWTAKDYVIDNLDLLKEALEDFGIINEISDIFLEEKWEYADVTIRCYLLGEVLNTVISEYV